MGTFAETTNVDYLLSFADEGKQTSVYNFRLQKTNESLPFPFIYIHIEMAAYI
jgi:hypothetical protein